MKLVKATPEVKAQVLEWYRKKCELGTQEQLAARLGISVAYVVYLVAMAKQSNREIA